MNKTIKILLGLVAIFAMASCQDATNPINALTVSSKNVEFVSNPAGNAVVEVSSGAEWSAQFDGEAVDWLNFTKEGNNLVFTASNNSSILEREAAVAVLSEGRKVKVSVNQAGTPVTITVDSPSIKSEVGGTSKVVKVTSNIDWIIDATDKWLTYSPETGKAGTTDVTITIPENTFYETRTTVIGFYSMMKKFASIEVEQDPFVIELSLESDKFEAPVTAGSSIFKISSNYAWTASSDADWFTVSPTSGEAGNDQELTFAYADAKGTERNAVVTVKAGNVTKTVAVHQDKVEIQTLEFNILISNGTSASTPFTVALPNSVNNAKNLGVLTYELKNYKGYYMEFYSSYISNLINSKAGILVYPYQDSDFSKDIREEAFAYIKLPAVKDYKLTSVQIVSGNSASSSTVFPVHITPVVTPTNAAALAAAIGKIDNIQRGKTTSVDVSAKSVKDVGYYMFMPPLSGSSLTYAYQFAQINLVYSKVK